MPRTPDRFPGEREDEGVILRDQGPAGLNNGDPSAEGGLRYVTDQFRLRDGFGVFNGRPIFVSPSAAPAVTDDAAAGHSVGMLWLRVSTGVLYVCQDSTNGAAVWTSVVRNGDKGDITVSGDGTSWSVDNDVVTNAKAANVPSPSLKGRTTAATGDPEDLSLVNSTSTSWNTTTGGSISVERAALTGDVTATQNSNATTIANDVVTNAKLANVASPSLKGRTTATTGDPEDLTLVNSTSNTWNISTGGSISLERAALTGDITASANSNTTAIAAGVIVDADVNAAAAIAQTKTGALIGDVTKASGSDTTAIGAGVIVDADVNAAAAIALSKLAPQAANTLVANPTASSAVPTALAVAADSIPARVSGNLVSHPLATLSGAGLTYAAGVVDVGGSTSIVVGASDVQRAALTGDVTAAQNSNATTIAANAVDNTKAADMAAGTFKGRHVTAAAGDPTDLTGAEAASGLRYPALLDTTSTGTIVSYAPTGFDASTTNIRVTPTGNVVLRGMPLASGQEVTVRVGRSSAFTVTLNHEDALALAGEAFNTPNNVAVILRAGEAVVVRGTEARCNVIALAQSARVPDADYGDVTVSGTGLTWTVDSDVVTNAKLANVASPSLKGRTTAATGDPEDLTLVNSTTNTWNTAKGGSISLERAALTGDITASANSNTTAIAAGVIVDADVNAAAAIAQTKTGALIGDVTKASGSDTTAIAAGVIVDADVNAAAAIALSKLAAQAANTLIANPTGGSAVPTSLAVAADSIPARVGGNLVSHPLSTLSGAGLTYAAGIVDVGGSTSIVVGASDVQRAALTGDVTASQNSNATTIANDAVSNAKLADMAPGTVKGRQIDAVTGDPVDLTGAEVTELLRFATVQSEAIAVTTNDLTLNADTTVLRLTPTGRQTLTGLTGGTSGRLLIIENVAAFGNVVTLTSLDAGSLTANRFRTPQGQPFILNFRESVLVQWEAVAGDWRVLARSAVPSVLQTVAGATGDIAITLNDDTTNVLIDSTGNVRVQAIVHNNVENRTIAIEHIRGSGSGEVTFQNQSGVAGTGTDLLLPNAADVVLGNRSSVVLRYRPSFWRMDSVSPGVFGAEQQGLVPVSGATTTNVLRADATWGTVATAGIADNAVTNLKAADMAAGTVKGRALGGGTGDPQDLTAAQLGEIARYTTTVADSTSTGSIASYTQVTETTTQVRFTGAAAATIHGIAVPAALFGKLVEFHVESGVAAVITFAHESGTATASERLRTPSGVSLALRANESVWAKYYDNRWRLSGVARASVGDADYGDVTVSAGGATWTIDNDVVSNAKLANVTSPSLKGRTTAATGDPEDLTLVNSTSNTWNTATGGSISVESAALTGDVTASANSNATTIANNAVTNAKAADMAAATVKGRAIGAGTGDPTDLTQTQLSDLFRVSSSFDETGAPGTYHNYAVGEGVKLLRINPNAVGDFIITGIALGSSNSGGWIRLFKQGPSATERIVLKHADAGSTAGNQFILPDSVDFILERSGDAVDLQFIGGRWQVVASLIGTTKLVDDAVTNAKAADMADSTIKGRALGAGTGDPTDLTGAQVGEILRLGTTVTEASGGSFAPYTLGATTNTVVVTAAATFHGITDGSEGREVLIINGAAFGSGINVSFVQFSSTTAGGSGEKILLATVFGTDAVAVVLPPGSALRLRYTSSRWRSGSPIDLSATVPDGTIWGRSLGAGNGLPTNLTGIQVGDIARLRSGSTGFISGTFNDYAVTDGVRVLDCAASGGDVIFTGFAYGSSNTGAWFWLTKFGGSNRIIIKHQDVGSLAGNRVNTPNATDFIISEASRGVLIAWVNTRLQVIASPLDHIAQGTMLGRTVLGGTGLPVALTGLEQGQNLRRGSWYVDSTTTGSVATYTIPEDATQIVFTGSGTITLQGATIITGKVIDWHVDSSATVQVTFVNDGLPTITQERFRCPGGQSVTIGPGEGLSTVHYFNRHRVFSVARPGFALTDGDKGDITVASSGTAWTIDNDAVSNAKLANMAAVGRVKGVQIDAVANDPVDLTGAEVAELLRIGTVQSEGGALPLAITLNADTTFLSITTAGDGDIRTITGSTLGRVVLVMLFASGTKTIKHNFSAGTSNALICPGLVDFAVQVRDSFFLVGLGTDGWQVVSAPLGLARVGTAQLANDAVSNAKLANVASPSLKGRTTATAGDPEDLTLVNSTTNTWNTATGGSISLERAALTGDITASANSNTTAIAAGVIVDADVNAAAAIALSKLATQAANTIVANPTAGSAVPTAALTIAADSVPARVGANLVSHPLATLAGAGLTYAAGVVDVGGSTSIIAGASDLQRAALTGDVTASQNSNATTIANDAVSNAKLANVASPSLKGRTTATAGDPEDLTLVNSTSNTWNTATGGSISLERAALTGDVTASANANATTIANSVVTNAKLANMAQATLKGRAASAGTGVPQDLTQPDVAGVLNSPSATHVVCWEDEDFKYRVLSTLGIGPGVASAFITDPSGSDSYWTVRSTQGNYSVGFDDAVGQNGRITITTGVVANDTVMLFMARDRSSVTSTMLDVDFVTSADFWVDTNLSTSVLLRIGFGSDISNSDYGAHAAYFDIDTNVDGNIRTVTRASSVSQSIPTGVAHNASAHKYTIKRVSSSLFEFYRDNVLIGQNTTNIPTATVLPGVRILTRNTTAKIAYIDRIRIFVDDAVMV